MTQVVRSGRADHRGKKEVDSSFNPGYTVFDGGVADLFDVGSVDGFEEEKTLREERGRGGGRIKESVRLVG